ncbi:MAG: glycosyltransferase [Candidatus Marinimicrobia bacterium]|nr:glycosyltransferase [Candidatus Neomarinimicrobiota bacterium]
MNKLIWFSEIKWDYLVTRKQQILSRFPKDIQILFIEPYVVGKTQHWLPRSAENITVLTIPFLKTIPQPTLAAFFDQPPVRWLFGFLGTMYLELFAMILGFRSKDRVIGLSSAFWGKIAARQPAALHFYDANDAHLDFPGTPGWLKEYLIAYLEKADLCFAVSPEIKDSINSLGAKNIHLLGNGVDFEHFSTLQKRPTQMESLKKPILGYAGAMDWLDSQLLRKVCLSFPEHDIVLIGPEIKPGWFSSQEDFQELSNLHYLGKVDYQLLPAFVQSFDIALIPFVLDELTKPLNPNKLYEYSAAGKPVVSMNYSSTINQLQDTIFVGNNHSEFIEQIAAAQKLHNPELSRKLAREHSWDGIAKSMHAQIQIHIDD